jgi:hypothetical protein
LRSWRFFFPFSHTPGEAVVLVQTRALMVGVQTTDPVQVWGRLDTCTYATEHPHPSPRDREAVFSHASLSGSVQRLVQHFTCTIPIRCNVRCQPMNFQEPHQLHKRSKVRVVSVSLRPQSTGERKRNGSSACVTLPWSPIIQVLCTEYPPY